MARVVIDTNVLVSAFINNGKARKLVLKLLQEHTVISSSQMLAELADVLSRDKFSVTSSQVDRFISILAGKAKMVSVHSSSKVIPEDPDDDIVLNTALSGKADYIVSGDKHLLKIACCEKTQILSVNEFIQIIAKK
ncbi:MAG TPA: putative toxin-antitoxin system toxin component, PIN family [Candidatus Bathyarchaeia archaeon]|nr:putative toxin-antitoxin system toxin component, PIN family [Candidatus Bathyarchaeia archaeon]